MMLWNIVVIIIILTTGTVDINSQLYLWTGKIIINHYVDINPQLYLWIPTLHKNQTSPLSEVQTDLH